jgi:hypothetical protein
MPSEVKLYQYKKDGEFVREWKNISDMLFFLKIQRSHFHEHICGTKRKCLKGFIFKKTYYLKLPPDLCYTRRKNTWSKFKPKKLPYKIVQYDMKGKFIKLWDSISIASNELNIPCCTIRDVVNNRYKSTKGFIFRKYNNSIDDINIELSNPNKYKKIIQYDLMCNKIKIWNNINEAVNALNIKYGIIYSSLTGKTKNPKKFIWKYKN